MVLFVNPVLLKIVSEKPQGEFTIKDDYDEMWPSTSLAANLLTPNTVSLCLHN